MIDSSGWKGITIDKDGCRVSTEEDDRVFKEALRNEEVMTFYEAYEKPLNDWKRQQTNTPVKKKKYYRDRYETLTGKKLEPLPNRERLKETIRKKRYNIG